MIVDDSDRSPNVGAAETNGPDKLRISLVAEEIDLGFAVPEDMDVGRFMVVGEDHDPQAFHAKNGHHRA
nr:hypothetical protein [Caulobacter segnis]